MWGVTHPIIECREKAVVKITEYMPTQWTGKERIAAYPRKPLMVYVSTNPNEKPVPSVIFGGIEGARQFIQETFGDVVLDKKGEPITLKEWLEAQYQQIN